MTDEDEEDYDGASLVPNNDTVQHLIDGSRQLK